MTGLVAQQQCVGPLHTPLADVAVVALSPFGLEGAATAIGEQPIKGLVSPGAGARMAVGEALTNLVFAKITDLKVSCGPKFKPQKLFLMFPKSQINATLNLTNNESKNCILNPTTDNIKRLYL